MLYRDIENEMRSLKNVVECVRNRFKEKEVIEDSPLEELPFGHDTDLPFMPLQGNARLHVVSVHFNYNKSKNIKRNFERFAQQMKDFGVTFYVVECALEGQDFEVTDPLNPHHVQVRAKYEIFRKENLLNIGFGKALELYENQVQYLSWQDADVIFCNENWVQETIDALRINQVVQTWSKALDLDFKHEPLYFKDQKESVVSSFAWCVREFGVAAPKKNYSTMWHCGYGWAMRRSTYDAIGGLYELAIHGSCDFHMAWAFAADNVYMGLHGLTSNNYKKRSLEKLRLIKQVVKGEVGVVDGLILHCWHGRKADRKYVERWSIPVNNNFEPDNDLIYTEEGVIELAGNKPQMIEDYRNYFRQRNDDCNTL